MRVSAFIDGFNLYHAIDDLRRNDLKWIDLRKLMEHFVDPAVGQLNQVYYFSAYCDWDREKQNRHKVYVRALRHHGVEPIMGKFQPHQMQCHGCDREWVTHEEKQSDVNLAISLVREAYRDTYDRALVVSSDSDFAPALRLLSEAFPGKSVKVVCPPERFHSKDLNRHAKKPAKIKVEHLEASRMPDRFPTLSGLVVRPQKYDP
jgi:uncharacterized LabA/DUF88 family protein